MGSRLFRFVVIVVCAAANTQLVAKADDIIVYSSIPAVDCVINPYRVVDISSPVAGVIEKLSVERSQQVSSGQVIARLEASVERANVELATYRASVESEIELGMVNIAFDRLRKQRVETLLKESNVSREIADQVEREVQVSEWKVKQARELVQIRQLELRKAQVELRQKSITSPFDGFVLDIFKYRGEYVEDQPIVRLAQLDPLVIEAIVPMENFGKIQAGMQAEVMPEILLKEKLRGEVIAVDRIGDTASNTFGVKLSIPNPENRIPAGLKCIAKFIEMTPEQIAAAADIKASEEAPEPQPVNPVMTETAEPESPGLLSSVIGNANAATAPSTYMVMIETPETRAETEALVGQLRDAGEQDVFVYRKSGRISLGIYSTRAAAEKRQREIQSLGFTTRTEELYQ